MAASWHIIPPFLRQTFTAITAVALCACLAAGLSGCRRDTPEPPPPNVLHLDAFADVPWPPGWQLRPGPHQVAISLAGGSIRRYDVTIMAVTDSAQDDGADHAMAWFAQRLPQFGWRPDPSPQRGQRNWRKELQVLTIRKQRVDRETVLRLRVQNLSTTPNSERTSD